MSKYHKCHMEELIGRKILAVSVSNNEQQLSFQTDIGVTTFEFEDDCSSETWFADVIGVKALLHKVVLSAEEKELPLYNLEDGRGRQDADCAYGIELKTANGSCIIVYRNSSNGCYGGELSSDGPTDKMLLDGEAITEDWSA